MARIDTLSNFLTDVADAIRTKSGSSEQIDAEDFDTEIENIPSGSGNNAFIDTSKNYNPSAGIRSFITSIDLIDTSNMTNMQNFFEYFIRLTSIPLINTSNVTNMQSMFSQCGSLLEMPLIDTSKVTNMRFMFSGCSSLITIPVLNTSSATNLQQMFLQCTSLSDESLNNILQMCINASAFTDTKTLSYLGFNLMSSTYPASRIQALSNYDDFIDAGWTIGY